MVIVMLIQLIRIAMNQVMVKIVYYQLTIFRQYMCVHLVVIMKLLVFIDIGINIVDMAHRKYAALIHIKVIGE